MSADSLLLVSGTAGGTGSQILTPTGSTATGSAGVLGGRGLVTVFLAGLLTFAVVSHSTGGTYPAEVVSSIQAGGTPALVDSRTRETLAAAASLETGRRARRGVAAEVLLIRQAFSLTMGHVAELLGVTRPAVYRWTVGVAVPRQKHRARLSALTQMAARFRQSGGRSVGLALHAPVEGDATLMDLLRKDPLPVAQLNRLLSNLVNASSRRYRGPKLEDELLRRGMLTKQRGASQRDDQGAEMPSEQHGDTRLSSA